MFRMFGILLITLPALTSSNAGASTPAVHSAAPPALRGWSTDSDHPGEPLRTATVQDIATPSCSTTSLVSQPPVSPKSDWFAYTSDASYGFTVFETFSHDGQVNHITWWGFDLYWSGVWSECDENPMPFQIEFYHDDSGTPGSVACGPYAVAVYGLDTGLDYVAWDGLVVRLWEYEAELTPPCELKSGWFSIRGEDDDADCVFLWFNSFDGDGLSFQDDGTELYYADYDRAYCFGPSVTSGEEKHWVGYQNGCMVARPHVASFFDGDNWFGYVVPSGGDDVILDETYDPQENGIPTNIHFGDFCVDVFACPNANMIPAGAGLARQLIIPSGEWTLDFGPGSTPGCDPPGKESGALRAGTMTIGTRLDGSLADGHSAVALYEPTLELTRDLVLGDKVGCLGMLDFTDGYVRAGRLVVGGEGSGSLELAGNGLLRTGTAVVAEQSGSNGRVELSGPEAEWLNDLVLDIGQGGPGTLRASDGARLITAELRVHPQGTLIATGPIATHVSNSGSIIIGEDLGSMLVGSFSQDNQGKLAQQVKTSDEGELDVLSVSGVASLGGTLEVKRHDGFFGEIGSRYTLLRYASSEGAFDRILTFKLGDGLAFDVVQGPTSLGLTIVRSGDLDRNGQLDLNDMPLLGECIGGPDSGGNSSCLPADPNGDGVVDLKDFAFIQRQLDVGNP